NVAQVDLVRVSLNSKQFAGRDPSHSGAELSEVIAGLRFMHGTASRSVQTAPELHFRCDFAHVNSSTRTQQDGFNGQGVVHATTRPLFIGGSGSLTCGRVAVELAWPRLAEQVCPLTAPLHTKAD